MHFIIKRCFHVTTTKNFFTSAINCSNLSKLRKKTGYPLTNCRAALAKFNDDVEQAAKWLDEQAQKEGWTKAEKLKDRATSQGLLGFIKAKNQAAIVELNCETDFVAKNEKFANVLSSITNSIFHNLNSQRQKEIVLKDVLMKVKSAEDKTKTVGDDLALAIGNLGENIILRRAVLYNVPEDQHLGWYMHGSSVQECIGGVTFAKYAALVSFKKQKDQSDFSPIDIGKQLAQHIVGMRPLTIGDVPKESAPVVKQSSSPKQESNPAAAAAHPDDVDNVVKQPESSFDENETRLLHQEFLMKPNTRVFDFLNEHKAEVTDFVRVECGEKLENETNS